MWSTRMTTVDSEQKYDQSIYQDFVLKDDVLVTINPGDPEQPDSYYTGHAELYEGDKLIHTENMQENPEGTAYELRISCEIAKQKFKPGKKYVLLVYEKNELSKYKMYIHKETIKILT